MKIKQKSNQTPQIQTKIQKQIKLQNQNIKRDMDRQKRRECKSGGKIKK